MNTAELDPLLFVHVLKRSIFLQALSSCPTPGDEFYVNILLKTLGFPSVLDVNFFPLKETQMGTWKSAHAWLALC